MNVLLKKESVIRVQQVLNSYDKSIKISILKNTARTALDASINLNCKVGSIVKSLMLRKKNSFFLCLISGDRRCSLNKLKKLIKIKDICLANAEDVKKITGFTIGGVAPVGLINSLEVLIDNKLGRFEYVYAAAGHPHAIFKIRYNDLVNITSGKVMDISE